MRRQQLNHKQKRTIPHEAGATKPQTNNHKQKKPQTTNKKEQKRTKNHK